MGIQQLEIENSSGPSGDRADGEVQRARAATKSITEVLDSQRTAVKSKTEPEGSAQLLARRLVSHFEITEDSEKSSKDASKPGNEPGVEQAAAAEPDAEQLDVGDAITWPKAIREMARPKDGQGYYDVMQNLGKELLGKELKPSEVMQLVEAAKAIQAMRGKDTNTLSGSDELLPKNQDELIAFLNAFGKSPRGNMGDDEIGKLRKQMYDAVQNRQSTDPKETLSFDLKPVKDQKIVTDVVPNAVYIDNSHIQGGQGYRRKENCESETQPYWLSKPTAEALMRAQKSLIDNGKEPLQLRNMNGAGRRALDRELISKCAPNQPHATRRSQHEFGISIDVDNYDNPDVRKAIEKEGFVHNVPGDRPHWTRLKGVVPSNDPGDEVEEPEKK